MRSFGPTGNLPFHDLLVQIGDDPEPFPPAAEAEVLERRRQALARARSLYGSPLDVGDGRFDHAAEFVQCFGEFQQSKLLLPLRGLWLDGSWSDTAFGALLRALLQAGCTTSLLLDECSVEDLSETLCSLPPHATHMEHELASLKQLRGIISAYRGGWARNGADLASRGMSWSRCRQIADQFVVLNMGQRDKSQKAQLLAVEVAPEEILAMFDHELEVLIHPNAARRFITISSEKVKMLNES